MWDAFTVDHIISFFRGLLWLIGAGIGAHLCFTARERTRLITFLGFVCVAGALFNIVVVISATLILFGVIVE